MSDDLLSLDEARQEAVRARADFRAAIDAARDRFFPSRLRADASQAISDKIDDAKSGLRRSAADHPLISWSALAVAATAVTYLVRRPALALL